MNRASKRKPSDRKLRKQSNKDDPVGTKQPKRRNSMNIAKEVSYNNKPPRDHKPKKADKGSEGKNTSLSELPSRLENIVEFQWKTATQQGSDVRKETITITTEHEENKGGESDKAALRMKDRLIGKRFSEVLDRITRCPPRSAASPSVTPATTQHRAQRETGRYSSDTLKDVDQSIQQRESELFHPLPDLNEIDQVVNAVDKFDHEIANLSGSGQSAKLDTSTFAQREGDNMKYQSDTLREHSIIDQIPFDKTNFDTDNLMAIREDLPYSQVQDPTIKEDLPVIPNDTANAKSGSRRRRKSSSRKPENDEKKNRKPKMPKRPSARRALRRRSSLAEFQDEIPLDPVDPKLVKKMSHEIKETEASAIPTKRKNSGILRNTGIPTARDAKSKENGQPQGPQKQRKSRKRHSAQSYCPSSIVNSESRLTTQFSIDYHWYCLSIICLTIVLVHLLTGVPSVNQMVCPSKNEKFNHNPCSTSMHVSSDDLFDKVWAAITK